MGIFSRGAAGFDMLGPDTITFPSGTNILINGTISGTTVIMGTTSGTTANFTTVNATNGSITNLQNNVSGTNVQLAGYVNAPASGGGLSIQLTASTVITGGMWVETPSGTNLTAAAGTAAAYPLPIGVALATAGSNALVRIQTNGVAYMRANGNITARDYVQKGAGAALDGVVAAGSATNATAYAVGISLNTAASGTTNFVPILLL